MTVTSTAGRVSYSGNGSTTVFSVPFYFILNEHLIVILRSATDAYTTKTITTHYTLSGQGELAGGSLTMVTAPASGEKLAIILDPTRSQELDYTEGGPFTADSTELALDKVTQLSKRAYDLANRSAHLPDGYNTTFSMQVPTPIATYVLAVKSDGTGLEWVAP